MPYEATIDVTLELRLRRTVEDELTEHRITHARNAYHIPLILLLVGPRAPAFRMYRYIILLSSIKERPVGP